MPPATRAALVTHHARLRRPDIRSCRAKLRTTQRPAPGLAERDRGLPGLDWRRDQSADPVAGVDAAVPALANAAVSDDRAAEDDRADAPAAIAKMLEALGLGGAGGRERSSGDGGNGGDGEDGLAEHG